MPSKYTKQPTDYSCSPIACYNLIKWSKSKNTISLRTLIKMCKCNPNGTVFENMHKTINYVVDTVDGRIKLISTIAHPNINILKKFLKEDAAIILDYVYTQENKIFYHTVLIIGYNGGYQVINDIYDGSLAKSSRNLASLLKLKQGSAGDIHNILPFAWVFRCKTV